jgi:hypothetical protein
LQLANKNNPPMITLRTEQEVRKLKQELSLRWNIATADRKIAKSLKGFAKSFSNLQS